MPLPHRSRRPGRASQVQDMHNEIDAVGRVRNALADIGRDSITFVAEMSSTGRTILYLLDLGPAVEAGIGRPYPGSLILVEGSVPQPWRRRPVPMPGVVPAPSADPALLQRTCESGSRMPSPRPGRSSPPRRHASA